MFRLILILLFSISIYANAKIPVIVNVSYEDKQTYPYYLGNGKKIDFKKPGLAIEAMQSIEKKLNIKFNFNREVGIRGQKKLQYNKVDLLLFASYKKSRNKMGVYPLRADNTIDVDKKSMKLSYSLYTLKDSKLDWDGKEFKNLSGKIGATRGYSIVKFLQENSVEVSENDSNLGDPSKLIANRIQGFANQDSKIDVYLKENPSIAKKIRKIKIPLKSKPYYMLFSHKFYNDNKELSNKIWEELKNLDTSNKFSNIRKKY